MAKYKDGCVYYGFKVHKNIAMQFERELELWKEETGMNVSRTDMLQLLVLRFCIGREEAREAKAEASKIADNTKEN